MGAVQVSARRLDDRLVVAVVGELDIVGKRALCACVAKGLDAAVGQIVLDLSGVSFMDAQGLSALVMSRVRALSLDRGLVLAGVSAAVRRLLEITRMEASFELAPDIDEAESSSNGHDRSTPD
ncbi:STAS domain-containing protein [Nonomuraea sp. NPDC050556]|uniref:STAS domain-containing protein n=1 Tax=Nonomuraea sp. NPDC050556 TaxID=3364369 RepID=UPI0037A2C533